MNSTHSTSDSDDTMMSIHSTNILHKDIFLYLAVGEIFALTKREKDFLVSICDSGNETITTKEETTEERLEIFPIFPSEILENIIHFLHCGKTLYKLATNFKRFERVINSKNLLVVCKIKTFVERKHKLLEFPSNEAVRFAEWYESNFYLEHFYRSDKKEVNPDINAKAIYNVRNLRFDKYKSCPLPTGEIESYYTSVDNGNIVNNSDSYIHFFMKHKAYFAVIDILNYHLYKDQIRTALIIIIAEYNFFESEDLTLFILTRFGRDRSFKDELDVMREILEEKNLTQYLSSECYSSTESSEE